MIKKRFAYSVLGILALISFLWLDFYLPSKAVVEVSGTEVKRMDDEGPISKSNPEHGSTRDVYFINTAGIGDSSKANVHVYRNEDTRWGWPFYFKFDSADIQAQAQTFAQNRQPVAITYYGWRINMNSMFPNITNIQAVEPTASAYSIRRYIVMATWLALFGCYYG